MSSDTDNRWTTYGKWDIDEFSHCAEGSTGSLVVAVLKWDMRGEQVNRQRGAVARAVWDGILSEFPEASGHRLSWSDLAFLIPAVLPQDVAQQLLRHSVSPLKGYRIFIGVVSLPADAPSRLQRVDAVMVGLSKIGYRKEYPTDVWCVIDGELRAQPRT